MKTKPFRYANMLDSETGKLIKEKVDATELNSKDKVGHDFQCWTCEAEPAFLVINREKNNSFRCDNHKAWCNCRSDKKKIEIIVDGYTFNEDDFIIIKTENVKRKKGSGKFNPGGDDPENGEINFPIELRRKIHKASSVRDILKIFLVEKIDFKSKRTGLKISDYFIDTESINKLKREKSDSFSALIMCRKFPPREVGLNPEKNKIWLRDCYTKDDINAMYFLVSVGDEDYNKTFLNEIYEDEKGRVWLFGKFEKVEKEKGILSYEVIVNKDGYVLASKLGIDEQS